MKVTPQKELEMVIAAMLLDEKRGDRKFTCVEALGYQKEEPVVISAAIALSDMVKAGNDPYKLFAPQITEYEKLENREDGFEKYQKALKKRKKARLNAPCYCGSNKKVKNCCLRRKN